MQTNDLNTINRVITKNTIYLNKTYLNFCKLESICWATVNAHIYIQITFFQMMNCTRNDDAVNMIIIILTVMSLLIFNQYCFNCEFIL